MDDIEDFETLEDGKEHTHVRARKNTSAHMDAQGTPVGNVVSSVSAYKAIRDRHAKNGGLREKYGKMKVEELLRAYHKDNLPEPEREFLREEILLRMFFLLPYSLKQKYFIPPDHFNDAVMNMVTMVLIAIEKFDPDKGTTFVNYIPGYMKSGAAKTFRDMSVVNVPSARRRMLEEAGEHEDTQKYLPPHELWSYGESASSENEYVKRDETDFDEIVHNRQLVDWLEEAISRWADVLTEDERFVLVQHYGLFGEKPNSYQEISVMRGREGKGCACSRLSQLNTSGISKLREFFIALELEEY